MKLLGKKREGAVDSLLRAYVSRPGNRECSEFDADLANAYIERSLTPPSRERYEGHLSECTPCRKNVIALSRLAGSESLSSIPARADSLLGARRSFRAPSWGVTAWTRWAMAAAAVIVLAISLPLLLTRNASRISQEGSQPAAESQVADSIQAASPTETGPAASAKQSAVSSPISADRAKSSEKLRADADSSNGPAPAQQPTGNPGGRTGLPGAGREAKTEPKPAEQIPVAKPVSEVAAGQVKEEKKTDSSDALSARQQQPSKDGAADTKASTNEQDKENAKEKVQVTDTVSVTAVPPPAAPSTKAGKMKRSSAIRALRESSATESVRPTLRVILKKKFSLQNDTWTDKSFDPDKDLPIVTVIRDSNVYNELLIRQPGLKPYLAGFPATERAIIVFNGTVYKLIPQKTDN